MQQHQDQTGQSASPNSTNPLSAMQQMAANANMTQTLANMAAMHRMQSGFHPGYPAYLGSPYLQGMPLTRQAATGSANGHQEAPDKGTG